MAPYSLPGLHCPNTQLQRGTHSRNSPPLPSPHSSSRNSGSREPRPPAGPQRPSAHAQAAGAVSRRGNGRACALCLLRLPAPAFSRPRGSEGQQGRRASESPGRWAEWGGAGAGKRLRVGDGGMCVWRGVLPASRPRIKD